jgi:pimeloyl-ACP methyl ester carboxylesterase
MHIESSAIARRQLLGGALAAGALAMSGCGGESSVSCDGEPVVPWPAGDILGVGLEGYPYPHPVQFLDVKHVAEAAWIDRPAQDWEQRARLAYMDISPEGGGSTQVVLLLHGKNFFGAYWAGLIEALCHNGYRVVVPDLIGWGKSTKPSTLTVASLVAHLRSLLDHLTIDSCALVGHSTGGLVAMHMARALPERLRALVLENPMGLEDYRIGLTQPVSQDDWAQDERSMSADAFRDFMAHYYVDKDPKFVEPFVAVRSAIARGPEFERWVQSSAAGYTMLLNEPAVDFVASLTTRTLFVCGTSDHTYVGAKYTAPKDRAAKGNIAKMAENVASRMAHARFVGVPGVGHVPHLEAPSVFASAVLDFLG